MEKREKADKQTRANICSSTNLSSRKKGGVKSTGNGVSEPSGEWIEQEIS